MSLEKSRDLQKCCWRTTVNVDAPRDPLTGVQGPPSTREQECAEWFKDGDDLLRHILSTHLQLPAKRPDSVASDDKMDIDSKPPRPSSTSTNGLPNGTSASTKLGDMFDFQAANSKTYHCRWSNCTRTSADFDSNKAPRVALLTRHIQTHLPDTSATKSRYNLKPDSIRQPVNGETVYLTTLQDERNEAAGVPLGAALVLRNIAKFMPQNAPSLPAAVEGMREVLGGERIEPKGEEAEAPVWGVFDEEVRERLFYALSHNRTIREYVGSILRAVKASGG